MTSTITRPITRPTTRPITSSLGAIAGQGGTIDYGLWAYAQDARAQAFYNSTSPAAIYVAARDETWAGYEAWDGTQPVVRVRVLPGASGTPAPADWGATYTIASTGLQIDSHGVPAYEYDGGNLTTGNMHCLYGNHNSGTRIASAVASAPATWTTSTSMTSTADWNGVAYANPQGTGDRTNAAAPPSLVTVTSSITPAGGTFDNLVDGAFAANTTDSVQFTAPTFADGDWIQFNFNAGIPITKKYFTEVTLYNSAAVAWGSWKFQYWDDISNPNVPVWVDLNTFTWSGATLVQAVTGQPTNRPSRFLRITKVGLTAAATSSFFEEAEFKNATVGPGTGSYPRPVMVTPNTATGMYLQYRQQYDNNGDANTSSDRLMLRKSSNLTVGSVAFGTSEQTMILLDGDSRCYAGNNTLDNGIIWFAFTRADFGDSVRRNVYVAGIDTNNSDRLTNWAGDFTLATTAWPLDLTTANAHFRHVTQTTTNGNTPTLIKLDDGGWILQYSDGDGSTFCTLFALRAASLNAAWSSPITVASMPLTDARFQVPSVAPYGSGGAGQCQFIYPVANGIAYDPTAAAAGGGDAYRRIMDANQTLHAPEILITQVQAANGETPSWPLNRFTPVRNGPAPTRFIFCQDNGDQTHNTGTLRAFMWGDSGHLGTDWGPDLSGWLKRLPSGRPTDAQLTKLYAGIKAYRTSLWYAQWWEGYWEAADTEAWSLIPFRKAQNTKTKSGTITFTANVGPKGNGTTGLYTTGWTLDALPATSIIQGSYASAAPGTVGRDWGSAGNTACQLYVTQASGNALVRFSSSTTYQPACDGTGMLMFVRDGLKLRLFQNATEVGTIGGVNATNVSTTNEGRLEFKSGAASFGSNQHGLDQVMCYFPPNSITAGSLQQADVTALNAAWQYFI